MKPTKPTHETRRPEPVVIWRNIYPKGTKEAREYSMRAVEEAEREKILASIYFHAKI